MKPSTPCWQRSGRLPSEEVPLLQALGRAAAERIVSPEQVPTFANSAMDGFAVSGAELEAGRREFRVTVDIPAGTYVSEPVAAGDAARIMTGAPVPPGPTRWCRSSTRSRTATR